MRCAETGSSSRPGVLDPSRTAFWVVRGDAGSEGRPFVFVVVEFNKGFGVRR